VIKTKAEEEAVAEENEKVEETKNEEN
jgi:hypothetical protein